MKIRYIFLFVAVTTLLNCTRNFTTNEQNPSPRQANFQEQKLITVSNNFGFKLFPKITAAKKDSNIFISPLSISLALSMACNGAVGPTADAIRQTIGFEGLTMSEINQNSQSLVSLLTGLDPAVKFNAANSVWNRFDFKLEPVFVTTLKKYYNAEVTALDFAGNTNACIDIINNWVSDKTEGKIDEIIADIHPNTILFLINALYFKADWNLQFDPDKTADADFFLAAGSTIRHPMMNITSNFEYFDAEDFQAIDLKYGNKRFSMTIFLPKPNRTLTNFLSECTAENWQVWLNNFTSHEVALTLPKFTIEFDIELKKILSTLGMEIAFTNEADFSRINALRDIYISKVKHKTFIELDEEGTEAAAVTLVEFREKSTGTAVTLNRPFMFIIRDHHADTIMFMGIMANPAEFKG